MNTYDLTAAIFKLSVAGSEPLHDQTCFSKMVAQPPEVAVGGDFLRRAAKLKHSPPLFVSERRTGLKSL